MGYRIFTDSLGTEWQAWDIIPSHAERRARERRIARLAVVRERRQADERRLRQRERSVLSHGMHQGWLCFEAAIEKRRLSPIPADWLRCTLARLEEYLRAAIPVQRMGAGGAAPVIALDLRTG